jgi:thiamine biosynthesis lipoprotein
MRYALPLPLLLTLLLTSCGAPPPPVHEESLYAFGTLVDVTLSGVEEAEARRVIGEMDRELQRLHREWHAWEPGPLTALNEAFAKGESRVVDTDLLALIRRSKELSAASGGLFNPAIGRLIDLWGFHTSDFPVEGPPPARDAIAALVAAAPSMDDITIEGDRVTSRNPAVALDFGAIGKGLAVDRAFAILDAAGIRNAIVNAGGDLRARGRRGDRPWKVGVRHPQGEGVIAAIAIKGDEAVFTSGNYERYRAHAGKRWPHILDPRTGMPVREVVSATVIVPADGTTADAAATALVVAGLAGWQDVARHMGLDKVMVVDREGTVYLTPAMAARVELQNPPPKRVVTPLD